MGVNIVKYGNQTLIDLTDTTAVASDVAQGKYFYGKDGVKTEGTATGGGGGYVKKTGSYTFASDYKTTNNTPTSSYTGSILINTGLTNIEGIVLIEEELLTRPSTSKRPYVGASIWFKGWDTSHLSNYPTTYGVGVIINSSAQSWVNSTGNVTRAIIITHDMTTSVQAGYFGLYAYTSSYYFKSGTTIYWEAFGT